jgi:hypothetical protein
MLGVRLCGLIFYNEEDKMIGNDLFPSVKEAVGRLSYGHFSLLTLKWDPYGNMTGPQARGFGKQFFDSVKKGYLNTETFRIIPVEGTKNPQMYEKTRNALQPLVSTYPPETLLKDASVEQAMGRIFEINFERLPKHYVMPPPPQRRSYDE